MNNTLRVSVATAALIAAAGLASAQGMKHGQDAPPPAAQQSAPAGKMGPALKETTGQATPESKAAEDSKLGQKASDPGADIKKDKNAQGPAPAIKSTTGQAQAPAAVPDSKPKISAGQTPEPGKSNAVTGASDTSKSQSTTSQSKSTTTGQGAAAAAPALSTEQRTAIHSVIKQQNVQPMTNVNFSISVGAQVPRTVHFHPVPVELVRIYPAWRGYDYFLVGDQIIVVNPRTHEIVAVLEA